MSQKINVNVEFLTRVEGHGNIVVNMENGELEKCELKIVEAPRLFEAMVRGRSIFEVHHITSRICGICSCGHTLACLQACEDAMKLKVSKQTEDLRKLLLHFELLDSHILHVFMLAAPDFAGKMSVFDMMAENEQEVRLALRMKKACNDACAVLAGRHIHPITPVVGGFTKIPDQKGLKGMKAILDGLYRDLRKGLVFFQKLQIPKFERKTTYLALGGEGYPLLSGSLITSCGKNIDKKDYKTLVQEEVVAHSTAKHCTIDGEPYAVGALARFNLNYEGLRPEAKTAADALGLRKGEASPYMNTAAQLVECFHCVTDAVAIIDNFLENGIDVNDVAPAGLNENGSFKFESGRGVGAVEVPRGILFHCYEIDEKGKILTADCIIPTNQNLANIEADMRQLAPIRAPQGEDEVRFAMETLVRAYDPCISCSTHTLKLDMTFINKDKIKIL